MSMTEPSIRDQAYQFFQQEALDLLQSLEDGLLNLRTQYDIPHIHELMRAAHSIKGGASSVQLPGIARIAHKLEDVFRALYRRTEPLDKDLDEALLQAYDCLRIPLLEQLQTGQYDEVASWETAEPIFDLIEAVFQLEMGADVELPTAAELGVDIVYEVFSGDVQRGIDRITAILEHPETETLAGEIRATAEVFVGIGDLLGLEGFSAIAQTTIYALNVHPDKALTIGRLTVESLQAAQVAVMEGDRTQGGSPSPALLALAEAAPVVEESAISTDAKLQSSQPGEDAFSWFEPENLDNIYNTASDPALAFQADPQGLEALYGEVPYGEVPSTDLEVTSADDTPAQTVIPGQSSLEDVFGSFSFDEIEAEANPAEESAINNPAFENPTFENPAFENVFGQFAFDVETEASVIEESVDNNAALEDIFGLEAMDFALAQDWEIFPDAADVRPEHEIDLTPDILLGQTTEQPQNSVKSLNSEGFSVDVPAKAEQKPAAQSAAYMTDSIRVDAIRLERLNNLVGELVTQENGVALQSQQLQQTLKRLQQKFIHFEDLSKNLQTWMDQSLHVDMKEQPSNLTRSSVSGVETPGGQAPATETSEIQASEIQASEVQTSDLDSLQDFDSLQMDSYGRLYTMLQEALEEIAQMGESIGDITLLSQQSQQIQRKKQQTLKQVRNDLMWARMIPMGDILNRFPRMVRDLATQHKKQVTFKQYGATTLVDKAILEKLYDPLVHLIRNAFDHGTESAEDRMAQNKPAEATIEVRAYHRGNQTLIEVRDDGRGIDPEKIRSVAIAQGLFTAEDAAPLSKERLYKCLFEPSFSTSAEVSDLSGRGMGMSAVQTQVQTLKGNIAIASEMGKGTSFTISLPLTLTIAKLLVFSINDHYMAIPVDTLVSIVAAVENDIETIDGQQYYLHKEQQVPLYFPDAFAHHYPMPRGLTEKPKVMTLPQEGKVPLLLIASGNDIIALEVDEVLDEQELVIKPFGQAGAPPKYLFGCAILGDGSLVPVIDGSVLVSSWQSPLASAPVQAPKVAVQQNTQTILVVDDSLTTRQNVTLTLQKFGYQVIQAGDGKEALEKLRQEPGIKAVFSDVEMPTMNGFEFLSACRKSHSASALPIIMLTSRSGDKHRGIAKLLGANEYLTKPYLEQDLLKSLQTCLEKSQPQAVGV
jgi:two-component system, chemotaxis family, sensor histidine kinase and response regulator PixL